MPSAPSRRPAAIADRRGLLRTAALGPEAAALAAWRAWSADGDPWRFDPASQWWMPLVWWNLRHAIADPAACAALRHEYTQAWIRSQYLLAHVAPVLDALHGEGIETLLLKGAALALTTYERPGLRPFGDIDVLVAPRDAPSAQRILERRGWAPFRRVAAPMLAVVPSVGYTDPHGVDLDLHWHAIAECCASDVDGGFWSRALPLAIGDVRTHVLCPSDQLLHVCTRGLRFAPIPTAHWMADAAALLGRSGSAIDWDVFTGEARRRRLTFQLGRALAALEAEGLVLPPRVAADLAATSVSWWERVEYRAKPRATRPSVALQSWCTEARSRALEPGRSVGFTTRLQAAAESDSRAELAGRLTLAALGLRRRRAAHVFDAFGRRIQIDAQPGVDLRTVRAALDDRLPRFPPASRTGSADRIYQLLRVERAGETERGYRVLVNRAPLTVAATLEQAADDMATDLQSFLAAAADGRTFVHAGVVSLQGRAIVMPGDSGSGKSTLVAALLRAGAIYASDEFAVIDAAGRVHAYPRPVKLRRPGASDEHVRAKQWGARTAAGALPPGLILFTTFRATSGFHPCRLSASAAMFRMLNHCPGTQARPTETLAALRALVAAAPAWSSDRPDTDTVVRALLDDSIGRG